jgi:hypothetical protein
MIKDLVGLIFVVLGPVLYIASPVADLGVAVGAFIFILTGFTIWGIE